MRQSSRSPHQGSSVLEDDLRNRLLGGMRDRKRRIRNAELSGKFTGPTMESNRRTPPRRSGNLTITPANAMIPARSQRLHRGLFRRKARRIPFNSIGLRVAVFPLALGKNALQETLPEAFDRMPDARDLRNVDACTDNHIAKASKQSVAMVNKLSVGHPGFRRRAVRFCGPGSVDVHDFISVPNQPIRNHHSMAAKVYALGTHVSGWRFL